MKKFNFKEQIKKTSKTYGWQVKTCYIYQLKNNDIFDVGEVEYCTASTMGAISEVNKYLINNKYIPKTWSYELVDNEKRLTKYYYRNNGKYTITEIL